MTPSGSVFVQISDENLHHVRELMDEIFGTENFIVCFLVKKTGSQKANLVEAVNDYLIWFAKDISRVKDAFKKLYERTPLEQQVAEGFNYVELPSGADIPISELKNGRTVTLITAKSRAGYLRIFPARRCLRPIHSRAGGSARIKV